MSPRIGSHGRAGWVSCPIPRLTTVLCWNPRRSGPVKNGAADCLAPSRQIMQDCTYEPRSL